MKNPDPTLVASINGMTQFEMAALYRRAPTGHPFFDSCLPYYDIFMAHFKELGGMTPEISKELGWD